MKLTLIAMAVSLFTLGLKAAPVDIVPKNFKPGSTYVRVTKISDVEVKFEKCISGFEPFSCKSLGGKDSYLVEDLVDQRSTENWQITGAATADIAIILALIYGGYEVSGILYTGPGVVMHGAFALGSHGGALIAAAKGVIVGGLTGVVLPFFVKTINPVEQARQAKTLNTEILKDELVVVNNMDKFIERLDLVLSKID